MDSVLKLIRLSIRRGYTYAPFRPQPALRCAAIYTALVAHCPALRRASVPELGRGPPPQFSEGTHLTPRAARRLGAPCARPWHSAMALEPDADSCLAQI